MRDFYKQEVFSTASVYHFYNNEIALLFRMMCQEQKDYVGPAQGFYLDTGI
jgi:hypothetical protein